MIFKTNIIAVIPYVLVSSLKCNVNLKYILHMQKLLEGTFFKYLLTHKIMVETSTKKLSCDFRRMERPSKKVYFYNAEYLP